MLKDHLVSNKHLVMKSPSKKIVLIIIMALLMICCKAQESNKHKEEAIKIMNIVLNSLHSNSNETICLFKETYFRHPEIKPEYLLNHYLRIYNPSTYKKSAAYELFYKEVDGIITEEELKEMKINNLAWSIKEWQKSKIKKSNITLLSLGEKLNDYSRKRLLRISEPLFSNDMQKAVIMTSSVKDKIGGKGLLILEKENGNWVIKGGIPIGTIG